MTRAQAPIANEQQRRAVTFIIAAIRQDWDAKGIESCLAKADDQNLDVLTIQAIIAAVTRPDARTPAVIALDGDHVNRARIALSRPAVTPAPPKGDPIPTCGVCDKPWHLHDADHPYAGPDFTAPSLDAIERARKVLERERAATRQETDHAD